MIKPIKFDLKLSNSETIATIDDLKNNLTIELFEHFHSGKLAKWLRVRKLDEQAEAVETLLAEIHDREMQSFKSLIELFGGEADVDSLRTAIIERKKASSSSIQNSDDEVEQLTAAFEKEIEALKAEIEELKNPSKPKITEERIGQFIARDDGTALDTTTDLTWCRYPVGNNGKASGGAENMNWKEAMRVAHLSNKNEIGGFTDWRLPTIDELKTIVNRANYPKINRSVFPNTPEVKFWSSSSYDESFSWIINFWNGESSTSHKFSYLHCVQLVRG